MKRCMTTLVAGAFAACSALAADVLWPTLGDGVTGVTGDVSSKGADGWNADVDFTADNTWKFNRYGTYSAQLFGKTLTLNGTVQSINWNNTNPKGTFTLDVDQGGMLQLNKVSLGNASGESWESSKGLRVAGASTLTATGKVEFVGGNCFIDVLGGSTFNSAAVSVFRGDWQDASVVSGRVTVVDSAWTAKGNVQVGGDYNHCANWEKNSWTLAATNSALDFAGNF